MTFTSIADLYFVSVGLLSLNILTDVLIDTGLIYLPFIIVIIDTLFDGFKSSKNMADTAFSLRSMETRCYGMLIVMIVAFLPLLPYNIDDTASYERMCSITGEDASVEVAGRDIGVAGTMVDVSGYDLRVPALLNYALNISNGVTVEAVSRLPCSINIVGINLEFASKKIDDGDLLLDIKEFMYQCYQPARSMALRRRDINIPWIDDPDTTDVSWPGHAAFRNSEYYGNTSMGMYSKVPMEGWQSSPNNAQYYEYSELDEERQNSAGYPTCYEWWDGVGSGFSGVFTANEKSKGLRERLLFELENSFEQSVYEQVVTFHDQLGLSDDDRIKLAYFQPYDINKIKNLETKDYAFETEGIGSGVLATGTRVAGSLGNLFAAFPKFTGASLIQVAAPIVKSIFLFVLIAPLPLAMLVSKYSMKFAVEYMFFLFAVCFCPFLWDLTILAQQSFIAETFGDDMIDGVVNGNSALIGTYVTDAVFLAFPTMLIGIFTAAGMKAGGAMSSVTGSMGQGASGAGSVGQSGGAAAQSQAKSKAGRAYSNAKKAKSAGAKR
ncbi:conjugal transfer protein TraG N-terminal domain-containing protein (plasmid) [Alteromonas macleodii]|uniref:conjugal transfer protein TraG N-terminal domain-containing protein n=1 Tax=Alteromonas macleodii TaxID=28108 RepID=UPI0030D5DD06